MAMAGAIRAREELSERLWLRRLELEETLLNRVPRVGDSPPVEDPQYALGLEAAVRAGVCYGLAAIEIEPTGNQSPPVPQELLAQARRAARSGVGLDTVLRRYVAGHSLLGDYVIQEAEGGDPPLGAAPLQDVLRLQAVLLDRLVVAVADAYADEVKARTHSFEHRRVQQVKELLAGESVDAPDLCYGLEDWHVAVVAVGPGMAAVVRELAGSLGCRLLLVRPGGDSIWAWLGCRHKLPAADVQRLVIASRPPGTLVALGEPGQGIEGWRLSHRQAEAAMPIAHDSDLGIVCYGDVALLTAALRDDVLAQSLRQAYLVPLENERDGGGTLRQTLQAYLAAGRNISSAAAALGVSRQTVQKRVCLAEERIGQPLGARAAEIETALRLPRHDPEEVANLQPG